MNVAKALAGVLSSVVLLTGSASMTARAADLADVLGVAHIDGKYNFTTEDYLNEGADAVLTSGVRTINLYLSPYAVPRYPFNSTWQEFKTVEELAQTPYFKSVFAKPFHTYILTTYSIGRPDHYWTSGITDEQKADETRQFYDLTKYLLTTYRGTGKVFVLQHWEGDWALHNVEGKKTAYNTKIDPTPTAIDAMIQWLNARQAGITKARHEITDSDVRVYGATETNRLIDQMNGRPGVVNQVLPHTNVDLVAYSSYESDNTPGDLNKAIDFIVDHLPSSAAFGHSAKSVYLGEWGGPEDKIGDVLLNRRIDAVLNVAQSRGLFAAIFWEVYANELKSEKITPPVKSDDQVKGMWLIKPDGLPSLAWLRFREALMTSNPRTATSDAIKANLTEIYHDDFNHNAGSDIGPGWRHNNHYGSLKVETADSHLRLILPEGHEKTWGSATLILPKVIGRGLRPGEYFEFTERRLQATGACGVEEFDSDQLRQAGLYDAGPTPLSAWTGDKVAGWVPFGVSTLEGQYDRTDAVDSGALRRACAATLAEFKKDSDTSAALDGAAGYVVIPETNVYDKFSFIKGELFEKGNVTGVVTVSQDEKTAPAELIVLPDANAVAKLKSGTFDPAKDAATTRASGAADEKRARIFTHEGDPAGDQKFSYADAAFVMPAVGETVQAPTSYVTDSGMPRVKIGSDVWLPGIGCMNVAAVSLGTRENPATITLRNTGNPANIAPGEKGWLGGNILGDEVGIDWSKEHVLGTRFDGADGNFATFSYYIDGKYAGSWMLHSHNKTLERIGMFCHGYTDGASFEYSNLRVFATKS